jgi:hypothetical protein
MAEGEIMFDDQVTILIPTSPIPCHPSTEIIDEVIAGLRHYFPVAKIVIMCDGVRAQVEHRRGQYQAYVNNLMGKYGTTDSNIQFNVFGEPAQQAWMIRETLKEVRTPYVLFNEHDAVLRANPPIEWDAIFHLLETEDANMVRFYHWDRIWWEHEYLMRGEFMHSGVHFVRTVQFSGWPLVSKTLYLAQLVTNYFKPTERKMIETGLYGPVCSAPWDANKIVIYYPDNADTFTHRDGRSNAQGVKDPGEW